MAIIPKQSQDPVTIHGRVYTRREDILKALHASEGGEAVWGDISGDIYDQTDLQEEFDTKMDAFEFSDDFLISNAMLPQVKIDYSKVQAKMTAGDGIDIDADNVISADYTDLTVEDEEQAGYYVSKVDQADGVISTTKQPLPTVADAAVPGSYVSQVSQTLGEIAVERVELPSLADVEVPGSYIASVTEDKGQVSVTRTELPSVTDTAVEGFYVSEVSEDHGEIDVKRVELPSVDDVEVPGSYVSAVSEDHGVIDVKRVELPSYSDEAQVGSYVSSVNEVKGQISLTRTELPSVTDAAVDKQFVTSVSESKGQITVQRSSVSSIVGDGLSFNASTQQIDVDPVKVQPKLVAGANITITDNPDNTQTISATGELPSTEWGQITGTLSDQTDLQSALDAKANVSDVPTNEEFEEALDDKQDKLIAGTNIQIAADGKTISATDTTYIAGNGISISGTTISADTTKVQKKLVAGSNITIVDGADNTQVISSTGGGDAVWGSITGTLSDQVDLNTALMTKADASEVNAALAEKQDKLIAGTNITIAADGKTISATDTTYIAGSNVQISAGNVISATDTKYTAGTGLSLSGTTFSADMSEVQHKLTAGTNITISGNTISATDTKYTAGTNVSISGTTISATDTKYTAGTGLSLSGTTFSADMSEVQHKLTAGTNITISGNTISATDTKYTAGTGIDISGTVISSTGTAAWGSITGTLSDQTDLNNALAAKAEKTADLGGMKIRVVSAPPVSPDPTIIYFIKDM